jgi:hypothetical protein
MNAPSRNPDQNPAIDGPFLIAEFRGAAHEEIKWSEKKRADGTTQQAGEMDKGVYSFELDTGMAVSCTQLGRSFGGMYSLKRGERYALKIEVFAPAYRDAKTRLEVAAKCTFTALYTLADFLKAIGPAPKAV